MSSRAVSYTHLEEALVSGNLDAVVIATPHGMHAEMSIQALDAGVNVFCEKPMSDSVEECMAMQEAVCLLYTSRCV